MLITCSLVGSIAGAAPPRTRLAGCQSALRKSSCRNRCETCACVRRMGCRALLAAIGFHEIRVATLRLGLVIRLPVGIRWLLPLHSPVARCRLLFSPARVLQFPVATYATQLPPAMFADDMASRSVAGAGVSRTASAFPNQCQPWFARIGWSPFAPSSCDNFPPPFLQHN